jgi:hypothetical protein
MKTFTPEPMLPLHGKYWLAQVIIRDGSLVRVWQTQCSTRWGARRLSKRMAKKMAKAYARRELY